MENKTEYLTIKEFATAANVSTQRIYQRLAKDLQPFCKTENGKKYLSAEGLKLFGKEDIQADLQSDNQALTNTLQETIEALREQLTVKDNQIAELQAALRTAQEQQAALTQALTQQQALHAGDIQRQITEKHEQRSDAEPVPPAEIVPKAEPEEPKGILSRLFSRLKK